MFGFLGVHSNHSLLRGVSTIDNLLEKSVSIGCDAMGLVDTHNLYGAIDFYKKAQKLGIKPIVGVTLYVFDESDNHHYSYVLLARNKIGYENILVLTSLSHTRDRVPYITSDQLEKHKEGIVVVLPPSNNPILRKILQQNSTMAKELLVELTKTYGEHIYLGITPQDITQKGSTPTPSPTTEIVALARENKVKIIPLPLIYTLFESDQEARDVLFSIQKPLLSNLEEDILEDPLLFPEKEEIEGWCTQVCPEALDHLSTLIQETTLEIPIGNWVFPNPPKEEGEDSIELLRQHIEEGYVFRKVEKTQEVLDRVAYEFDIITSRGYTDYFLVVIDLVKYMHAQKILTTTRGSAAGSMISYLCAITNVDPILYKLPFERFLNPYRPSPPDVDLDIADDKRQQVIEYIVKQYGVDKVAQIGTLGTMMARAAVRDTARALGYSYITGDRIAKLIPMGVQGAPMYIDKALEEIKELRTLHKENKEVEHVITVAKKIEGNPRHMSVHAAGVIISPTSITSYSPVELDTRLEVKRVVSQFNMHALEDVGLLKFDILGLTNLSILSHAIEIIHTDYKKEIQLEEIPIDDHATYKMISEGFTIGIFQLGGSGMTNVLKRMNPTNIYDIATAIALYRPGPMKNIEEYIERKQGRKSVSYLHPDMKKFLTESYGVLVYQDDLLYITLEIAGYNWEEVDVFRKAVGKKIPELFVQQEKLFKSRVLEKGLSKSQTEQLWDLFTPFKGYGFNKAHAMSYALVAYQTAYVKRHYTAQYMASHLSASAGDVDSVAELIYESQRLGVSIRPPDINYSHRLFTTEDDDEHKKCIRVGLSCIKQVGDAVCDAIVKERNLQGPFTSIEDFLTRMASYNVINRRSLEALIKVGVFDYFYDRTTLLEHINLFLQCVKESRTPQNQQSLFDATPSISLNIIKAQTRHPKMQLLFWEKELLGVYVSGHPLRIFKKNGIPLGSIKNKKANEKVMLTAIISSIKPFRNKSGEKMLFLTLEDDQNNQIEAACFPKETEEYEELLGLYRPVQVKGQTSIRNNETTLKIDYIENPQEITSS